MVPDPRASLRADPLRPLNAPGLVTVLALDGRPAVLIAGGRRARVVRIQDVWRVDDEWWRLPVSRRSCQLVLESGVIHTVYHDLVTDAWYTQAY